ncbi:formate/nitrite transporter family protein [Candidatus Saccharibacteria bacterium]|nr:formate/nitrite transporter family protein [Candidatus Saccharibacteria bacterium]
MLAPAEIAEKTSEIGVVKANLAWWKMILLGMFAGMFIALAGVGATFANIYAGKLAGACVFTAGLAMVVVAGSELFTGNNLMVVALFSGKIGFAKLLKNWILVFMGNMLGAVLVAGAVAVSGLFDSVTETVIAMATAKVSMGFFEAAMRGVLCNFLVCIAVWMSFSANTVTGKIAAVFLPVMLFVLCGFEHSVANMFYVPAGMIMGAMNGVETPSIQAFLMNNLLPVTIGNIVGGAVLVGGGYFLAFMTGKKKK